MNATACAAASVTPRNPTNPDSYTGDEIQYDPARRLSLNGELGVHISAIMLEGDTLEHLAHGDTGVLTFVLVEVDKFNCLANSLDNGCFEGFGLANNSYYATVVVGIVAVIEQFYAFFGAE